MEKYTKEDWHRDRNFNAQPGQEVDEEIYDEMFDVMPPARMPMREETAGYVGFCVGEPASTDEDGNLTFSTFGKREGKYYYLGKFPLRDTVPFKEIARLRAMLNQSGIPYRWFDLSKRMPESGKVYCYHYQIRYYGAYIPGKTVVISAVEGTTTQGSENDRIEIQTEDKEVYGNLTAEEVFASIKKHWTENRLK